MRVCLVALPGEPATEAQGWALRAKLLAAEHEVTTIDSAEPDAALDDFAFAGDEHRTAAAVLTAIERAYAGGEGPDYLEVPDRRAPGLVALQARRCGHPLLERTTIAVRLCGSVEIEALHDCGAGERLARQLADLEREQLRLADRVIWPGGDVLGLYRRHYPFELPESVRIGELSPRAEPAPRPARRDPAQPLRILYAAPLRRSRGAIDLAEACLRLPADEWRLTMIGEDSAAGPLDRSVRLTIEAMAGPDPRLEIAEAASAPAEPSWDEHDLLVVPSRFEAWPETALEAMGAGLPVLATPVGGLVEIVEHGVSGWLCDDLGPVALRRELSRLLTDRDELERVRASGAVFRRHRELTAPDRVATAYEQLLATAPRPATPARGKEPEPLVSGVVPYYGAADHVEEAVASLLAQTHRELEVVIVNDGSFAPADDVLAKLGEDPRVRIVTQLNSGETAARNLGARVARGEYVAMLDADNVLEPEFVARALEVFRREPDLAYVSCWLRFVEADGSPVSDPAGYAALGNQVVRDDIENWDGDTLALLPRRLFSELGYGFDPSAVIYSDWELYRWLREDGRFGTVIPERLARYRVLGSSLQRAYGVGMRNRGWEEAKNRRLLRSTAWTAQEA